MCVQLYIYIYIWENNLETICLLLAYKIKYLELFLLRGNHEVLPASIEFMDFMMNVKIITLNYGKFSQTALTVYR